MPGATWRSADRTWTAALPWVLASLPFVLLVAWFWNRGPGLTADDWAQTLMHAEALTEGRAYSDIPFIASQMDSAPARQPPGLPMVVAATMVLTGGFHWWAVKLAMVLTAFPFVLLGGLAFSREYGSAVGTAVSLMLAVAVAQLQPHGPMHVQSDLGFAGLVWASLWLLDRPGPLGWWRVAAVFAFASLAMAYRYLGAALVPTIALFMVLNLRKGTSKLAMPLGIWVLGAAVVIAVAGTAVITGQVSLDPYRLVYAPLRVIGSYSGSAVAALLYPLPGNLPNDVFHVIALAFTVVGLVDWTRTNWRTGAWLFVPVYFLTLVMAFNRSARYVLPLYPVLIFGFVNGVRIGASALRGMPSRITPEHFATACAAAISVAATAVLLVTEPRIGGYLPGEPDARDLFAYLEENRDGTIERVAFVQPRTLSWTTGIRAMVIPGEPPDIVLEDFDHEAITHVVLDRLDLEPRRSEQVRAAMAAHACRFEEVYENASFQVYRFLPECTESVS